MRRSVSSDKICATCGRPFARRRKWKDRWDEVRYCGAACRRRRPGRLDQRLERAIVELLERRDGGATICPSEASRYVDPEGWRDLLERTRRAARRLAHGGRVEVLQGGKVVDPGRFRGPIRLRLRR